MHPCCGACPEFACGDEGRHRGCVCPQLRPYLAVQAVFADFTARGRSFGVGIERSWAESGDSSLSGSLVHLA